MHPAIEPFVCRGNENDIYNDPKDLQILCKQYGIECTGSFEKIKREILNAANSRSYEINYLEASNILIDNTLNFLMLKI